MPFDSIKYFREYGQRPEVKARRCRIQNKRYAEDPDFRKQVKARNQQYAQTPKGRSKKLKQVKKYQATPKGKAAKRREDTKYQQRFPERERAHWMVKNAVKRGKISKPSHCEACLKEFPSRSIHGHHRDYSRPLEVQWLCFQCHKLTINYSRKLLN